MGSKKSSVVTQACTYVNGVVIMFMIVTGFVYANVANWSTKSDDVMAYLSDANNTKTAFCLEDGNSDGEFLNCFAS